MKNKYLLSGGIISFGIIAAAFLVANGVSAQTASGGGLPGQGAVAPAIQYPVPALGNCADESACRAYCDDTAHLTACLSFAEKNNLMSKEEIQMAEKFAKAGKGPGGCTSRDECDNYCNNSDHINECVAFAEQNGLISGKELAEAKKVQAAIAKGIKPPACGGKSTCDQYCSEADHMEECIIFGQAAGLMSEKDLQDSQKMLTAIKKGVKPPACRGKDECDRYCGEASHAEECINFAEAAGFMKPEEAVMARKTGGRGPGGCKNKDECETFCNNSDNQETCFNFGRENGMIPPEELQKMEEVKQQFSESLKQAPPQVTECISGVVGVERLEKFKSGAIMPPQNIGDKIGGCFRQMMDQPRQGQPGQDQSGQFQPGPGVINPGGQMMPPPAGPGGCKTPEECRSLCESNPDACRSFKPGEGESQNRPNENEREEMMPDGKPGG